MNPPSTIGIILIIMGLFVFIYFGVLVPVFASTNRAKLKYYDFLKKKYNLSGDVISSYFKMIFPSVQGLYSGRNMIISTILSRDYYAFSQKYSIPLTRIEISLLKKTYNDFRIDPKGLKPFEKSDIATGVELFDKNFIVKTNHARDMERIVSPAVIEKILTYRKTYGRYSMKIIKEGNTLVSLAIEPSSSKKKIERAECMIEILQLLAESTENISGDFYSAVPIRS